MAAPRQDGILPVSFWADEDLSAKQFYAVTAASTQHYVRAATGASNPVPLGIVQDADGNNRGDAVQVRVFGFSKAVVAACHAVTGAACDVRYGTYLTTGSDGKLYPIGGAGSPACARSFEAMTTGSAVLEVFFWGSVSGSSPAAS